MTKNRLLPALFVLFSSIIYGQQEPVKLKFYGFVRNDFNFNSRQNFEAIDGLFHIYPKPIELGSDGKDKNGVAQAEMLSIATRIGINITGNDYFGAKSSAKIETDLAGFGGNYYVLRIRQAYAKLNWTNDELLVGQTWHPLFGSVMPTGMSLNAGCPFQPFNRSPQIKFKHQLSTDLSISAAAIYQMQYLSQGPLGSSVTYMKNAILPEFFVGLEYKKDKWTAGIGAETKTIKPIIDEKLTSFAAMAYAQYVRQGLQIKAKSLVGQNLTDYTMMGGYGASEMSTDSTKVTKYTNYTTSSSWFNLVLGTKIQYGIFVGYSQNLGSKEHLALNNKKKMTSYGNGNFEVNGQSILLNRLIRVSPHVSYNVTNLTFGLEYDLTRAQYGNLQQNGKVSNPYDVDNHRVVASVSYFF